jgi:hypothetical protein
MKKISPIAVLVAVGVLVVLSVFAITPRPRPGSPPTGGTNAPAPPTWTNAPAPPTNSPSPEPTNGPPICTNAPTPPAPTNPPPPIWTNAPTPPMPTNAPPPPSTHVPPPMPTSASPPAIFLEPTKAGRFFSIARRGKGKGCSILRIMPETCVCEPACSSAWRQATHFLPQSRPPNHRTTTSSCVHMVLSGPAERTSMSVAES